MSAVFTAIERKAMRLFAALTAIVLTNASPMMGLADAVTSVQFTNTAEVISPSAASDYIGVRVTVEGVVSEVARDPRSGNVFLNFGGRYPNQAFDAIIFDDYAAQFSGLEALEDVSVAVSGEVQLYRGKPQIVVRDPSQLNRR